MSHALHILILLLGSSAMAAAELVSRDLGDPKTNNWQLSDWHTADGQIAGSDERPPEATSQAASLQLTATYSGKDFQYITFAPVSALIPGDARKITLWAKRLSDGHSWALRFIDAQGRDKVGNTKLEKAIATPLGQWQQISFDLPDEWERPIAFGGIVAHNWSRKQEKADAALLLHDLRLHTDIAAIGDVNQLVSLKVESGFERNIFVAGDALAYRVGIDSWLGKPLQGLMRSTILDMNDATIATTEVPFRIEESAALHLPLQVDAFGVYRANLSVTLDGGIAYSGSSRFAYLPAPHQLTVEQKLRSPWGINIHGGKEGVAYNGIARTGYTWVRDYAYAFDWMVRARGTDGNYAAWPWYPRMNAKLEESGLMLLACLMHSISHPVKEGILAPTQQWKRDLLHILWAFPQYTAWEIDNEYDLHYRRDEEQRNWTSYDDFHSLFGKTVNFVDNTDWAVENGTAGIHPERVRQSIARGAFDEIDVVNAHFYCGTAPPEIAIRNANTGGGEGPPALVWDLMRELAQAADSDGRDRQAWITEFGWDTLAVHIVTEAEQAAYLQRGNLLGLQAGLDKMFWYWNLDTEGEPNTFFDGCGIFDQKREPKPVVAAQAAMSHFLLLPEPLGTFDFGPNSMGHLFRDRGRLVACAFQVDKDKPSVPPRFASGKLHDHVANPLTAAPALLTLAPLWAVDLDENDPIVRQTSFDIATRRFLRGTAGDATTVQLRVRNRRATAISASYTVEAPDTWQVSPAEGSLTAPPGESRLFPIHVSLPANAQATEDDLVILVTDGDATKRLDVRFIFMSAAELDVQPLSAAPGEELLQLQVRNNSLLARSFRLRLDLPASWQTANREMTIDEIQPGQTATLQLPVTWSLDWQPEESAHVVILSMDGAELDRKGIRPGALPLPAANSIALDGSFDDWPTGSTIPGWALGQVGPAPPAQLRLAHAPDGLYVGVNVEDADGRAPSPRQFWTANVLELFTDTANDKASRTAYAPTDHQLWVCPILTENRVYMGRWKRDNEIPETQYDIEGLRSAAIRTASGYAMEFFIPASLLHGFETAGERRIGLNLNLSIPGSGGRSGQTSEIYWPLSKTGAMPRQPHTWGSLYLR